MFAGTILQDLKSNSVMTSEPRALETVLEQLQAKQIKTKEFGMYDEVAYSVYQFSNGVNLFVETDYDDNVSEFWWITDKEIEKFFS